MNCLKNSRSVLSRLLRPDKPTAASPLQPQWAQAPLPGCYQAYRVFRDNAASARRLWCRPISTSLPRRRRRGRGARKAPVPTAADLLERRYRKIGAALLLVVGGAASIWLGNLEVVPYTNRTHFVIPSPKLELQLGEFMFAHFKRSMEPKLLPPLHPDSIRVRRIASEIVGAVPRGLASRQRREDGSPMLCDAPRRKASAAATAQPDDEVLNVTESRDRGKKREAHPQTGSVLDGWELVVVRNDSVNAMCLPGGKIVVFTGLLDKFSREAEIATVLGHEVGHAIARHHAEAFKNLYCWIFSMTILQTMYGPSSIKTSIITTTMSTLLGALLVPRLAQRKREREADHIGLMLLAAAGYDPSVALSVHKRLGNKSRDSALSTHPSSEERAQLLSQVEVMNEAVELYWEYHAGRAPDIFSAVFISFFFLCFF